MRISKANNLLLEYYGGSCESQGKDAAVRLLKEVVAKGVVLLSDMPRVRESERFRGILDNVRAGQTPVMVEKVAAKILDIHKTRSGRFITVVKLTEHGVNLLFLPDVEIARTKKNQRKWANFLARVSPRHRCGVDPETALAGRIPYRDGTWLGDLIFQPGLIPEILDEISRLNGSFSCDTTTHRIGHPLEVGGNLHVKAGLLALSKPVVSRLEGDLHVYGEQAGQIKHPLHLSLPPTTLAAWGLRQDNKLVLGDRRRYRLGRCKREDDDVVLLIEITEHDLGQRNMSRRYYWDGSRWKQLTTSLSMDTANRIRVTLNRFPFFMGLGKDFLENHTNNIQENISTLMALIDICQGVYNPGRECALPDEYRKHFNETGVILDNLSNLAALTGEEDEFEIEAREAQANDLLDSLTEDHFHMVKQALDRPMPALDMKQVRQDMDYLKTLTEGETTTDKVLGTPGRTLVFLNNVFLSKEAKARAASLISPIRKLLRKVAPPGEADKLLIVLLRKPRSGMLRELRISYPGKKDEVAALGQALSELGDSTPSEILRKFTARDYEGESADLALDRAFLAKVLQFGQGPLDDLFRYTNRNGTPHFDMDTYKNALWVNLQSFIGNEVRLQSHGFKGRNPTQIAHLLLERLSFLAPVIRIYNNVIAGGPTQ